jgi:adenylylsulfate kinase
MDTGFVVWFTGVAATGKSTVATIVEQELRSRGLKVENLDSDEVRANISPNLGYTLEARDENTKRLAFLGKLLSRNGVAVLITAVSSLRADRPVCGSLREVSSRRMSETGPERAVQESRTRRG